nr:MAG: hypothetical protein 1 [Leviviridae sp.]
MLFRKEQLSRKWSISMRTRTQKVTSYSATGVRCGAGYGVFPNGTKRYFSFVDDRKIVDEVHAWPIPKGKGLWDYGGYLHQVNYTSEAGGRIIHSRWLNTLTHVWEAYDGPIFAYKEGVVSSTDHILWSKTAPVSEAVLFTMGATAVSRCAPTNPHASLSQALGELRRDGIPALPGLNTFQKGIRPIQKQSKRKGNSTSKVIPQPTAQAGSEYLNVAFGWKPLYSDVRKLAALQHQSKRLISQYVRDSGRLVRRRYEFPTTVTRTEAPQGDGIGNPQPPYLVPYLLTAKGIATRTITVTRRMWFSGAFTYHVSEPDSLVGSAFRFAEQANHLTGAGINASVMWDLMPWSWAVDWMTNIGDVVNNASMMSTDGLVMVYGYIMAETVTDTTITVNGVKIRPIDGSAGKPILPLTQTFTETVRQRRRAYPFGFGLTFTGFTPHQLAIVAALGLSRDGRALAL